MDFRRIPFQFTSTDPAKRNAELQRRFGLPKEKMYVDLANPSFMGSGKESNSASSSPRLQHRVPLFVEGSEPVKSSVDDQPINMDSGQKPRVRVVPIEIENPDGSRRHRTLSGSTFINDKPFQNGFSVSEDANPGVVVPKSKSANVPRVYNIPIKIDDDKKLKAKTPPVGQKEQVTKSAPVKNGCNASKTSDQEKVPPQPDFSISLKKIETVLEKLKSYQADVEKFSGTVKDKQYRYLDEMLTRLMLDLDDVDTMGNENIRLERKAAIKKVQYCVDLLDTKIGGGSQNQTEASVASCEEVMSVQSEEKTEVADMVSVEDAVEQDESNADSSEEMMQSEEKTQVPNKVSDEDTNSVNLQESKIDKDHNQAESNADSCEEMLVQSEEKTNVVSIEGAVSVNQNSGPKSSEPLTELEENSVDARESEMIVESTEIESDLQQMQSMETDDVEESMPVVKDELESCNVISNSEPLTISSTVDMTGDQMGSDMVFDTVEMKSNNTVTSVPQDVDCNKNDCDTQDEICDRTDVSSTVETVEVSSTATGDSNSVHSKECNVENTT